MKIQAFRMIFALGICMVINGWLAWGSDSREKAATQQESALSQAFSSAQENSKGTSRKNSGAYYLLATLNQRLWSLQDQKRTLTRQLQEREVGRNLDIQILKQKAELDEKEIATIDVQIQEVTSKMECLEKALGLLKKPIPQPTPAPTPSGNYPLPERDRR
ncbi:MAG: hypothetical protein HY399_05750 [Elusimicrobia bacterium]|nr:hypothetical protein [Elusimicrobiota bacterium]